MEESFHITVPYEGTEHEFETRILWLGYTHKIEVDVYGTKVHFEPDEERNYRAVVPEVSAVDSKVLKPGLLQAIAHFLEQQVKE